MARNVKSVKYVETFTGAGAPTKVVRLRQPKAEDRPPKTDTAKPPATKASMDVTLKWVGTDVDRAKLVMAREVAGQNRVTLIAALADILGSVAGAEDTGAPDDSPTSIDDAPTGEQSPGTTEATDDVDGNADDESSDGYADGHQGGTDGVEGSESPTTDAQEA